MISTEVALIMTAGMLGGSILITQLTNHNWFKREKFKFNQQIDRKEANIRFKRLEKDLKIKDNPPIPPRENTLVETLQNLNPEMIKTLAGALTKNDDEYYDEPEGKPDITEIITDIAQSNPELVKQVIDKFTKKGDTDDGFQAQN